MTEKDEVIARWVGIEYGRFKFGTGLQVVADCPDFTDLTTLFKWCVPKLEPEQMGAILYEIANALADKRDPGEAVRAEMLSLIESEKEVAPTRSNVV